MSDPNAARQAEEQFRESRRTGIGGSDAAAILGVNPFSTALDVYNEKLALVPPKVENNQMKRGKILEPIAVNLYREVTGRAVRKQPLRRHRLFDFILGNVDRQIVSTVDHPARPQGGGPGVLETKCPNVRVFARIKREKQLPVQHVVQLQHYLMVYGYAWGSFVLFNADLWEMIHFDVEADQGLQERMLDAERIFWQEHIVRQAPPTIERPVFELPDMPKVEGSLITRDDSEFLDAAQTLKEAKSLKETADDLEQQAKDRIKELMVTHGAVEGGGIRVYWKQRDGRVSFDRKALETARPLDRERVFRIIAALGDEIPAELAGRLNERLGECGIEFKLFEKRGEGFEEFRSYFLAADSGDDE